MRAIRSDRRRRRNAQPRDLLERRDFSARARARLRAVVELRRPYEPAAARTAISSCRACGTGTRDRRARQEAARSTSCSTAAAIAACPSAATTRATPSSFICSYHGWSYGLDGALTGVPKFNERYHGALDREKWGLDPGADERSFTARSGPRSTTAAPSFEDYLGADMKFYLRDLLQGPDGEDDGYEVIGGIVKWQMPCNWKFGAENFAGDHYHGYSHLSVDRLSIGLSGKASRHHFRGGQSAAPADEHRPSRRSHRPRQRLRRAHAVRIDVGRARRKSNEYYRTCHEQTAAASGRQVAPL